MPRADAGYFRALVEGVWRSRATSSRRTSPPSPTAQPALLDPIEHAVLLIGLYELSARPEVPYRVAINEAVGLAQAASAPPTATSS